MTGEKAKMVKKQNTHWQTVLTIILGVTLLALYAVFLFVPQLRVLEEKKDRIEERTAFLVKMEKGYRHYAQLEEQDAALRAQILSLSEKVPKSMDKPEIIVAVYNKAKKNEVVPISLNFEDVQDKGLYKLLPLDFQCEGSYNNVMALISELQQDPAYYFTLSGISFQQEEDQINAKMRLFCYSYND